MTSKGFAKAFAKQGLAAALMAAATAPALAEYGYSLPGQLGCQRFFTTNGRVFCLYIVIGSYRTRALLANVVNDALATFVIR